MPDIDAISSAIAARYAPGLITPPSGLQNIREATADLPQALGKMPIVLVFPPSGEFKVGNGTRIGTHRWTVRFYFGLTRNLERELKACGRWATVLIDVHGTSAMLGGLVTVLRTVRYTIGRLDYASKTYTGIELALDVTTTEGWTPSA